jgi:hypothetical protein
VAASALLLLSTLVAVTALLVGTVGALVAALVAAVVVSWAVARLGHDQLVGERLGHAEDRVTQARAFRSLYLERSAEHALFAAQMRDRLHTSERLGRELRTMVRLAEARADQAQGRVAELEAARDAALAAAAAAEAEELVDELAAWDVSPGGRSDRVVDLLAWEQRAQIPAPRRRHA